VPQACGKGRWSTCMGPPHVVVVASEGNVGSTDNSGRCRAAGLWTDQGFHSRGFQRAGRSLGRRSRSRQLSGQLWGSSTVVRRNRRKPVTCGNVDRRSLTNTSRATTDQKVGGSNPSGRATRAQVQTEEPPPLALGTVPHTHASLTTNSDLRLALGREPLRQRVTHRRESFLRSEPQQRDPQVSGDPGEQPATRLRNGAGGPDEQPPRPLTTRTSPPRSRPSPSSSRRCSATCRRWSSGSCW